RIDAIVQDDLISVGRLRGEADRSSGELARQDGEREVPRPAVLHESEDGVGDRGADSLDHPDERVCASDLLADGELMDARDYQCICGHHFRLQTSDKLSRANATSAG